MSSLIVGIKTKFQYREFITGKIRKVHGISIRSGLSGYETDDQSIQPCADEASSTGSSRVVQRDRLSLDTRGIEIGDLEGLVSAF